MSSIETLKEQARRHEQKEEWQKALDLYGKAIDRLDDAEQPDISLFNRVGDLNTRIGRSDAAVEHYDRAVDLYMEAELPNNAIAVCKKIVRNLPNRHAVYLRMGQIRASQGFLVDARASFLTYAERVQGEGDLEEALRALGEFADLVPDDTEIRMAIAAQHAANDQPDEAIRQLAHGWAVLNEKGDVEGAAAFAAQAAEIDPDADLSTTQVELATPAELDTSAEVVEEDLTFESTALGGDAFATSDDISAEFGEIESAEAVGAAMGFDEVDAGLEVAAEEAAADVDEDDFADLDVEGVPGNEEEDEDLGGDLPLMTFDDDDGDAAAIDERAPIEAGLDDFSLDEFGGEDDEDEDLGGELPLMTFDDDETDEEVGDEIEVAHEEATAEPEDPAEQFESLAARAEEHPEDVGIAQSMVETAFRLNDESATVRAYLALAGALQRSGNDAKAKGVFQQVLAIEPDNAAAAAGLEAAGGTVRDVREVAASEEYVDLGAMILDDEDGEKTTRFTVAYQEPSGDEAADFKKMLSQFKAKVAENFDASDVKAHHDLGTAYKEMGLLDEAIEEFQQALRASADHLPTYELLGQVFMEKGEPEAAVNTLDRALRVGWEVEDDLIGIYYHLGRANEEIGRTAAAVEFYDKVFALDINFADVTERLRNLR